MLLRQEWLDGNRRKTRFERGPVRAKLRIMVKRVLPKYGYRPDKQEKATKTVLEQAELLCEDWTA